MSAIIKMALICVFVLFAQSANAAVIFPSVIDVDLDSGLAKEVEIAVKNSDIVDHEYIIDIIGVELGQEEGEYGFYNFSDEVLSWFSPAQTKFDLIKQEERIVKIEITPDQNAQPQVIVAGVRIVEQSSSQGQIGVNSGFVTLLFITIDSDKLQGEYQVVDFSSDVNWNSGELTTFLTIQNNADKIVQPIGSVIYKNILGLKSKVTDINPEARRVASGQTKTYSIGERLAWGFGPYFVSIEASPWEGAEIEARPHVIWIFSVRSLILLVIVISMAGIIWRYVKRR